MNKIFYGIRRRFIQSGIAERWNEKLTPLQRLAVTGMLIAAVEVLWSAGLAWSLNSLSWQTFGLGSLLEFSSGEVLYLKERQRVKHEEYHDCRKRSCKEAQRNDRLGAKVIGWLFLAFAVVGPVEYLMGLGHISHTSGLSVVMSVEFIIATFWLARREHAQADLAHSSTGHADAHQSDLCALSGVLLLIGQLITHWWSPADSLIQFAISALFVQAWWRIIIKGGRLHVH